MIADEEAAGGAAGDHFATPGANDRVWNALEKLAVRDPEAFVDYYANDVIALVSARLARPRLPGHLAGQRRPPGRPGAGPAPRLPPRLPRQRGRRAVPDARAPALAGAHPAGRGGALATCRSRAGRRCTCPTRTSTLPGYLAWRRDDFRGLLRRAPRPAAAAQGRRRVLQPGAVPRRRLERLGRHPADGQPAAGLLGVRPGDGAGRPGPGGERRLPGAAGEPASAPTGMPRRPWPRPPRATRSRPTSTSTSRSTG